MLTIGRDTVAQLIPAIECEKRNRGYLLNDAASDVIRQPARRVPRSALPLLLRRRPGVPLVIAARFMPRLVLLMLVMVMVVLAVVVVGVVVMLGPAAVGVVVTVMLCGGGGGSGGELRRGGVEASGRSGTGAGGG